MEPIAHVNLADSIVADFVAEVELSDWPEATPSRMRVVMNGARILFAPEDERRPVPLSAVFDVTEDLPAAAGDAATGTVTLGFDSGESREVASITAGAETLIRFQRVLFTCLLEGVRVGVRHRVDRDPAASPSVGLELAVTPSTVRFLPASEGGESIVLDRNDVTEFKTASDTFAGKSDQAVVTLYAVTGRNSVKTTVRLPSFRLLNLFGRYLESRLALEAANTGTSSGGRVAVLLVDDDPDHLDLTELFLNRQSDRFTITTATSASAGLELLVDGERFDCVVSDFSMPGHDGIEFLRAVRERYPELPFILYTGWGNEEVAKRAILDDVTDYVEKHNGTEQYANLAECILKAAR